MSLEDVVGVDLEKRFRFYAHINIQNTHKTRTINELSTSYFKKQVYVG